MTFSAFTIGGFLEGLFLGAFSFIKELSNIQTFVCGVFLWGTLCLTYNNKDFLWEKLTKPLKKKQEDE